MDIRMPGVDGLEATRQIAADERLHDVKIVILTTFDLDEYVFEALRVGASGFLVKDTEPVALIQGVRAVAQGDALLSPGVTRRLIEEFAAHARAPKPPAELSALTEREREVLDLIAGGKSNAEIGRALQLSTKTVANYVSTILTKLQITDRAEAIIRARDAGMGQDTREWDELGAQG
jgi:DNA-binding NarL/FixJ family response regulator